MLSPPQRQNAKEERIPHVFKVAVGVRLKYIDNAMLSQIYTYSEITPKGHYEGERQDKRPNINTKLYFPQFYILQYHLRNNNSIVYTLNLISLGFHTLG
jgi:hypothetical protein